MKQCFIIFNNLCILTYTVHKNTLSFNIPNVTYIENMVMELYTTFCTNNVLLKVLSINNIKMVYLANMTVSYFKVLLKVKTPSNQIWFNKIRTYSFIHELLLLVIMNDTRFFFRTQFLIFYIAS